MKPLPSQPDAEKWAAMSFNAQMANIGSEVGRTAKWIAKGKDEIAEGAFVRALDLFDLTIKYGRKGQNNRYSMLRELCLTRDEFSEAYFNKDSSSLICLEKYFTHFAIASLIERETSLKKKIS